MDWLGLTGSLVGTGASLYTNKKNRKDEEKRFNKMFDFNAEQVDRTNQLEKDRQDSIDNYYNNQ